MNRFSGWIVTGALALCMAVSPAMADNAGSTDGERVERELKKKKKKKKKPGKPGAKKADPVNKKTVSIGIDHGVIFSSGKVKKDGSGSSVDLIVYKQGKGFKVNAGRKGSSYNPLHKLGKTKFASMGDVPCFTPGAKAKNKFVNKLEPGHGFTVLGNKSKGTWRLRVKSIKGGKISFEFDKCN
jgi:hypothetical protein